MSKKKYVDILAIGGAVVALAPPTYAKIMDEVCMKYCSRRTII